LSPWAPAIGTGFDLLGWGDREAIVTLGLRSADDLSRLQRELNALVEPGRTLRWKDEASTPNFHGLAAATELLRYLDIPSTPDSTGARVDAADLLPPAAAGAAGQLVSQPGPPRPEVSRARTRLGRAPVRTVLFSPGAVQGDRMAEHRALVAPALGASKAPDISIGTPLARVGSAMNQEAMDPATDAPETAVPSQKNVADMAAEVFAIIQRNLQDELVRF
jgi:hypothetical protein